MSNSLCYERRLNTQLDGISLCLRSLLTGEAGKTWHCKDSDFSPNAANTQPGQLSDSSPCLCLSHRQQAWLKISPLAPGAIVCTELLIQSDDTSFATLQAFTREHEFTTTPSCTMTSEQFHARFRPDSTGHALQTDRAQFRLLIMMPDASEPHDDSSLVDKLYSSLKTLLREPEQTSIECLYKDAFGAARSRELLSLLKSDKSAYSRLGMSVLQHESRTKLSAMMGSASLALCGSSASLADALQFGLPVIHWNPAACLDISAMNKHSLQWFQQGCLTEKTLVARQQRESWLRQHTGQHTAIVISNKNSQLRSLIDYWLNNAITDGSHELSLQGPKAARTLLERPSPALDIIIPSAFLPTAPPGRLQRLRTSFERKQRKFDKFRQSPVRFFADSEVRWLRAFKHPRT